MLKLLRINNIALVTRAELELGPGLTLLTGETGRGQVDPGGRPGLVLGARASTDLVRTGADRAVVEAVIESERARDALEGWAFPPKRTRSSSAARCRPPARAARPSTARWCPRTCCATGRRSPSSTASTSRRACSIPERTSTSVDHHAGVDTARGGRGVPASCAIEGQLEALRRDRREAERRREMLEFQLGEIDKAGLRAGEEEELRGRESGAVQRRPSGRALERSLRAALRERRRRAGAPAPGPIGKVEELSGIDGGSRGTSRAVRPWWRSSTSWRCSSGTTRRAAGHSRPARRDRSAAGDDRAVEAEIRGHRRGDPGLRGALPRRAAAPGLAGGGGAGAGKGTRGAAARYFELALALSRKRRAAAKDLEKKVEAELAQLAMEKTRFRSASIPTSRPMPPNVGLDRTGAGDAPSSCSRRTRARSCARSRASRPAASFRGSCLR